MYINCIILIQCSIEAIYLAQKYDMFHIVFSQKKKKKKKKSVGEALLMGTNNTCLFLELWINYLYW